MHAPVVDILRLLQGPAERRRQRGRLGLRGGVVVGVLDRDRLAGDDELAHRARAVGGDDADVADAGDGVGAQVTRRPVFDEATSLRCRSSGFSASGATTSADTPPPDTITAPAPARL